MAIKINGISADLLSKINGLVIASGVVGDLLLDLYQGAVVAYSLRKLKTSYSSACLRVRRSSDDAEQDIGFDASGNLDTASLLAHCGANDGFVTAWYDQSGGGRDLTNSIISQQPQIVSSGSYLGEIVFNPSNSLLLSQPYFVFGSQNTMSFFETNTFINNQISAINLHYWGNYRYSRTYINSTALSGTGRFYTAGVPNQVISNFYLANSKNVNHYSTNFGGSVDDNTQQLIRIWRNKVNIPGPYNINRDQWIYGDFEGLVNLTSSSNIVKRSEFIIYPDDSSTSFEGILDSMIQYANPYLLDIFSRGSDSEATAAYSLRRLSNYVTNVIRVRRDSDDLESDFSPEDIEDGTLESWVGSGNNGYVTVWYNQSDNSMLYVRQTVIANQPQIVDQFGLIRVNGFPSIKFTDSTSLIAVVGLSNFINADLFTNINIFALNSVDSNFSESYSNDALWLDGDRWVGLHFANSPNRAIAYNYDTNDDNVSKNINLQQPVFSFFQHKNNEISLIINDEDEVKVPSNNTGGLSSIIEVGYSFDGFINEMIWTKNDQLENLNLIKSNINNHYNIYP